jgi:hypothetical protein
MNVWATSSGSKNKFREAVSIAELCLLRSWRWRRDAPLERRFAFSELYGVIIPEDRTFQLTNLHGTLLLAACRHRPETTVLYSFLLLVLKRYLPSECLEWEWRQRATYSTRASVLNLLPPGPAALLPRFTRPLTIKSVDAITINEICRSLGHCFPSPTQLFLQVSSRSMTRIFVQS